jgi:hypothetical protein
MAQKKRFNQSKNFLTYLGSPVFKIVLLFVLAFGYFFQAIKTYIPKTNSPQDFITQN